MKSEVKADNSFARAMHPLGLALAGASGIAYVICTLAFALWPAASLKLMDWWFHGIGVPATVSVTWGGAVIGLIATLVSAYLFGILLAWLWEKCKRHCERY